MIWNWKGVASGAWSMWALYLIGLLQVAPELLGLFAPGLAANPGVYDVATAVVALAGAVGRLIEQRGLET